MQAIMINDNPKWCAKIMNGEKTIEVRKNKALASAIQKLIDENGYAEIYVYCSKGKPYLSSDSFKYYIVEPKLYKKYMGNHNGKVLFKFRCYKVEEMPNYGLARRSEMMMEEFLKGSCLTMEDINKYALHKEYDDNDYIYAINISDLEIFNEPKELCEFKHWIFYKNCEKCPYGKCDYDYGLCSQCCEIKPLTKAPQNMVYVEIEK